jgi:TolB-like protein/Tfp pilus assembly protein PilF
MSETGNHREIPDSEIRDELGRILGSPVFLQSERLSRFLRYTVEAVLADKGETLKEFAIGTDVYDRQPPYHPSQDSIVRTEARRLRGKLRDYYESEGKADPVLIYFRPGSYAPVFRLRDAPVTRLPANGDDALFTEGRGVSIAVIPFDSDGEGAAAVCAAALTDELIHELMHTEGCRVASAGSAAAGSAATRSAEGGRPASDLPTLAQKLGVQIFFEGSVRREASRLRVTVRIVAPDGFQLWSQRFEIEPGPDELFEISEQIARSAVNRTRPELTSIRKLRASAGAGILRSYPAILSAEALLDEGAVGDIERAVAQLRELAEALPDGARPLSGIAQGCCELALRGANVPAAALSEAKQSARRAIAIDREMIHAHGCLATIAMLEWNWSEAETGFEYALMLGRRAAVHRQYAIFLGLRKRFDEAWSCLLKAREMDAFSHRQRTAEARFLHASRRYQEADSHFPERPVHGPLPAEARLFLAMSFIEAGRPDRALKIARELRGHAGLQRTTAASLAEIFARCGEGARAAELVAGFDLFAPSRDISRFRQALLALALEKDADALALLESAFAARDPELIWLQTEPRLDSLRGNPGFAAMAAAVGEGSPHRLQ